MRGMGSPLGGGGGGGAARSFVGVVGRRAAVCDQGYAPGELLRGARWFHTAARPLARPPPRRAAPAPPRPSPSPPPPPPPLGRLTSRAAARGPRSPRGAACRLRPQTRGGPPTDPRQTRGSCRCRPGGVLGGVWGFRGRLGFRGCEVGWVWLVRGECEGVWGVGAWIAAESGARLQSPPPPCIPASLQAWHEGPPRRLHGPRNPNTPHTHAHARASAPRGWSAARG
jgi:hypothetical protein